MAGAAPPVELPASTRALAKDLAEAICAAREACVGPSTFRELEPDEPCVERVAAELRARELFHLASAIDAGHVLYDPSGLSSCLAELRALACDVVAVRFPGPCANVLIPNVAPGGECLIDAECEGAGICEGDAEGTCPTTCRARAPQGVACRADAQCQDGLTCAGGVCQRPPQQGMACGGEDEVACGRVRLRGRRCGSLRRLRARPCAARRAGRRRVRRPGRALCRWTLVRGAGRRVGLRDQRHPPWAMSSWRTRSVSRRRPLRFRRCGECGSVPAFAQRG